MKHEACTGRASTLSSLDTRYRIPWLGPIALGDRLNSYQTHVSHDTPTLIILAASGVRSMAVDSRPGHIILVSHVAGSLALDGWMRGSIG